MQVKINPMEKASNRLEYAIFWSRWLQAPLYFGLIICQAVYVYRFGLELWHLTSHASRISETEVMLLILGMVDVVMIANLLYMVIIGGYETFVSKILLAREHPDRPDWLGHIDANLLKIKLAVSLVTISSIHLLKTFINAPTMLESPTGFNAIILQIVIHIGFIVSAIALAYIGKLTNHNAHV